MLLWIFGKVKLSPEENAACVCVSTTPPQLRQNEQHECRREFELDTWREPCQITPHRAGILTFAWEHFALNITVHTVLPWDAGLCFKHQPETEITLKKGMPNFLNKSLSVAAFCRLAERPWREHTYANHRPPLYPPICLQPWYYSLSACQHSQQSLSGALIIIS